VNRILLNLSQSVGILVKIFFVILLVRAVASFFPARRPGIWATVAWVSEVLTEPVLAPIRDRLPPWGGLDLSPLVALLLAYVAAAIVQGILVFVAGHL
jgi:YggT family protein